MDGGGEIFSTGGDYLLGSTIGQPDAGLLEGGCYALQGGFWFGVTDATVDYEFYFPLVLRSSS